MKNKFYIIFDDDKDLIVLLKRILKRFGISDNIISFTNGIDVLNFLLNANNKIFNNNEYILLLDIRMPVISGIDVLKKIKNDSVLKKIKVIMITSSEDEDDYLLSKKLGCLEYLKKPIDFNKLSFIFNQYEILNNKAIKVEK